MSKRNKQGFTRKQKRILDKTACVCILCGLLVDRETFSQEHLQPRSKNGSNSIDNLWACHRTCNEEKGNMTLEEFTIECDRQRNLNRLAQKERE